MRLRALAIAGAVVTAIAITAPAATARPAAHTTAVHQQATAPTVTVTSSEVVDLQTPHSDGLAARVACPTASTCVAEGEGFASITTDATDAHPTWTEQELDRHDSGPLVEDEVTCAGADACMTTNAGTVQSVDPSVGTWRDVTPLSADGGRIAAGVSCVAGGPCAAYAADYFAFTSDPVDVHPSWTVSESLPIEAGSVPGGDGAACASAQRCVIGGYDDTTRQAALAITADPTDGSPMWTTVDIGQHFVRAVACPSEDRCVVADESGNVGVLSDLGSGEPTLTWVNVTSGDLDLACTSATCVLISGGEVWHTTTTAFDGWVSESESDVDPNGPIEHVSCTSTACAYASVLGRVVGPTPPTTGPADPGWPTAMDAIGRSRLTDIACPTVSVCVATDDDGGVLTSTSPLDPTSWHKQELAPLGVSQIECASADVCVVAIGVQEPSGTAWGFAATTDLSSGAPVWTKGPGYWGNTYRGAVVAGCVSVHRCYVGGYDAPSFAAWIDPYAPTTYHGNGLQGSGSVLSGDCTVGADCVLVEDDGPTAVGGPDGFVSNTDYVDTQTIAALSCPTASFCVGTDGHGTTYSTNDPSAQGTWTKSSGPTYDAIACLRTVRVCLGSEDSATPTVTADPAAGRSAWSTGGVGFSDVSCPTSTCFAVGGDALGSVEELTVAGSASRPAPTTQIAATQGSSVTYAGAGPPATAALDPQQAGTDTTVPGGDQPPAITSESTSSIWQATPVEAHGSGTAGYGVALYSPQTGWFPAANGSCLGVGTASLGSTLYVGCEGTDGGYYTATTALPLTTSSRLSTWVHRPGTLTGAPALAVIGGQVHVAVVGVRGVLYTQVLGQAGFTQLPTSCAAAPALAGYGSTGVLACHAGSGPLLASTFSGGRFGGFANLGGAVVGQPGAALGASGATFVVEGTTRQLYTRTTATGWTARGGQLSGGASITSL